MSPFPNPAENALGRAITSTNDTADETTQLRAIAEAAWAWRQESRFGMSEHLKRAALRRLDTALARYVTPGSIPDRETEND